MQRERSSATQAQVLSGEPDLYQVSSSAAQTVGAGVGAGWVATAGAGVGSGAEGVQPVQVTMQPSWARTPASFSLDVQRERSSATQSQSLAGSPLLYQVSSSSEQAPWTGRGVGNQPASQ